MKVEDQVVSPELAQRLNELGVRKESLFRHYLLGPFTDGSFDTFTYYRSTQHDKNCADWVAAYTVAELGKMLPAHFPSLLNDFGKYHCYSSSNTVKCDKVEVAGTEADARAKMLIYLLENKLITA
jgi:hypothetical protein